MLKTIATSVQGPLVIEPVVFSDSRGSFHEVYRRSALQAAGIDFTPSSVTRSESRTAGILRGLHYQSRNPQARLVTVLSGEVFSVALDVRSGSPGFARWTGVVLSSDNRQQYFIPGGFAHGFVVLADGADVQTLYSGEFAPDDARGVLWNDPQLAIAWPYDDPLLSDRDRNNPRLSEISDSDLPKFLTEPLPEPAVGPCFLSYASQDSSFARTLFNDLQNRRLNVWFAPESLEPGDRLRQTIDAAIAASAHLLIVISTHSIASPWVEAEVEAALELERTTHRRLVVPIALDDEAFSATTGWAAALRRTCHIADFRNSTDESSYRKALDRLTSFLRRRPSAFRPDA